MEKKEMTNTNTIDLKKTITTLTITILLISTIAFIGIPIASAQPATYYVDDDTGDDSDTGLTEALAFKTITHALTIATTPGDTIIVLPGTYDAANTETFPLEINTAEFTIKSRDGAATTTIEAASTDSATFEVTAVDVTIGGSGTGFTIVAAQRAGVYADEIGGSGIRVEGDIFKSSNIGEYRGMFFENLADDAVITGNSFTTPWVGTGILVRNADGATISNNIVAEDTVRYCFLTFKAETFYYDRDSSWAEYVAVDPSMINDVLVTGNTIEGMPADREAIKFGASTKPADHGQPQAQDLTVGIDGVTISDNLFKDNGVGVAIDPDKTKDSQVAHIYGVENILINYNEFDGNDIGVENGQTTYVDATLNWWGTADLSDISAMVSGNVNYDPAIQLLNVGNAFTVSGSGVTSATTMYVYWDYPTEDGLIGTTTAEPDGSYECEVTVPEDVAGYHYVWVKAGETGTPEISDYILVHPTIELEPTSGLVLDPVTITGLGFSGNEEITLSPNRGELITTPVTITTDSLGSFTAEFDVIANLALVTAEDESGYSNSTDFTIGAAITLTPNEGPTGEVVRISGRGFTVEDTLTSITIGVEETSLLFSTITMDSEDEFVVDVVIPTRDAIGEYVIEVIAGTDIASATFTVTGLPEITVSPIQGLPGTSVTVEGVNFTQIAGTEVIVDLADVGMGSLYTDSDGCFTGTLDTPVTPYALQDLTANDGNVTATTTFLVGMIYASLIPDEGPTGIEVSVAGTGFTVDSTANCTIDGILVLEDVTLTAEGTFPTETFFVPTVPIGDHTVIIMDAEGVTYEGTFTVTDTTRVELDPVNAPNDYNVTIEGWNFADVDGGTLTFVLYNATDDWTIDVLTDPGEVAAETDADGNFTAWWLVPADTVLDLGEYTMNITGAEDLFAQVSFSVVEPHIEIHTLLTEYNPGDTVSFYVNSTFALVLEIDIKDPTDYPFTTIAITADDWTAVGDYYVVPYADASFDLPIDAVTGTWNWTAYEDLEKVDTGVFTVIEEVVAPQLVIGYTPETVYQYDIVTVNVTVEGTPIAGASVTIIDPDGVSLDRTTTAAGTCTFTADEVGGWSVFASKSSYTDAEPVTITVLEKPAVTEYSIELTEGWNLVSLPLIPDNSTIEAVLADVMENVTVVYAYNATAEKWSIYNPAAPEVSSLTIMVDGKGYWIKMSASATLIVHGTEMPEDPTDPLPEYPVVEGWNLIGYKETYSRKVSEYLSGVEYSTVYGYWDGAYHRLGADDLMDPGRGYWVAVTAEGTIYP